MFRCYSNARSNYIRNPRVGAYYLPCGILRSIRSSKRTRSSNTRRLHKRQFNIISPQLSQVIKWFSKSLSLSVILRFITPFSFLILLMFIAFNFLSFLNIYCRGKISIFVLLTSSQKICIYKKLPDKSN